MEQAEGADPRIDVDDLDLTAEQDAGPADAASASSNPPNDAEPISRRSCHVCALPKPYLDQISRMRFGVTGGRRMSLSSIVLHVNQMLERDGIRGLTITKPKLSRHLRRHGTCDQRVQYGVQVAARAGRSVAIPPGTPSDIVLAVPAVLDPSTPEGRTVEGLTRLIESGETMLARLEIFLDGGSDIPDLTAKAAIAGHCYVTSSLRNLYVALHRVTDPKRTVASFLVRVARSMMFEVIDTASRSFGELAKEMPEGRDRARLQSLVVQNGRSFASKIDEIAKRYDEELASIASGEVDE